VKQTNDSGKCM